MNVTLFDYGAGNLHSLGKALELGGARLGIRVQVESSPERAVRNTAVLILPGVGAFSPAAARMAPGLAAMRAALADGLPCLGICLGMQLLFEQSDEGVGHGLGVIPGVVRKLSTARVPQIGWNAILPVHDDEPLLAQSGLDMAYYANSFVCRPAAARLDVVTAWSEHEGERFPAVVRSGRIVGTQFHPEKSSAPGIRFLQAFLEQVTSHSVITTEAMT